MRYPKGTKSVRHTSKAFFGVWHKTLLITHPKKGFGINMNIRVTKRTVCDLCIGMVKGFLYTAGLCGALAAAVGLLF